MRKAFASCHLEASVQRALNGHTLCWVCAVCRDGGDQAVQLIPFFLEFLDETLDGPFAERFRFPALTVTHERVDDTQAGVS